MPDPAEDCDGFSTLTAAMLLCAGIPCAFRTVAALKTDPNSFSHVYVVAKPRQGTSVVMDTSHGPAPGAEHRPIYRKKDWQIMPIYRPRLGDDDEGGTDWGDVINTISNDVSKIATPILTKRYGVPQLAPGQYLQTGPNGTSVQYQAPAGATGLSIPGIGLTSATSQSTLLLVGGFGLVLLVLMRGSGGSH